MKVLSWSSPFRSISTKEWGTQILGGQLASTCRDLLRVVCTLELEYWWWMVVVGRESFRTPECNNREKYTWDISSQYFQVFIQDVQFFFDSSSFIPLPLSLSSCLSLPSSQDNRNALATDSSATEKHLLLWISWTVGLVLSSSWKCLNWVVFRHSGLYFNKTVGKQLPVVVIILGV